MFFVALEGVDGVGKSTVHRGWWEEGEDSRTFHPGLVHRLKDYGLEVVPSREPGSIDPDDPVRGSIRKTYLHIERHLAWTLNFMGAAYAKTDHPLVRRLLTAAGLAVREEKTSHMFTYIKTGQEGPLASHIEDLRGSWAEIVRIADIELTLAERIQRRNARDLIRQALVYSRDSDTLPPLASGLLFLANHVLHGEFINSLPEDTVVVSDRSADSNYAYGKARGDDPRIWELYEEYRFVPDLILLLTCPVEVAQARTSSRRKRESKQWVDMQKDIAEAYATADYPCPVARIDTNTSDYDAPIRESLRETIYHINKSTPQPLSSKRSQEVMPS